MSNTVEWAECKQAEDGVEAGSIRMNKAFQRCVLESEQVVIAGVPIHNVTMDEAIERLEQMIRQRDPCYVVTPNIDHIVRLQSDSPLRRAYEGAALVLADGMPLLWASRLFGNRFKEKVSGSDLLPRFCAVAARKGYRIFFLGGRPWAAHRAAEQLTLRYPGLRICGVYCPPFGFELDARENDKVIEMIRKARPDVLFVGLGMPKGENWVYNHCRQLQVPVSINVGAAFDFVAGFVRRAPVFMQRHGLEWLWRLMLEPRRLYRRYLLRDPQFFVLILRQLMSWRKTPFEWGGSV